MTERRADRPLFEVDDGGRKGAGAQLQGQIFGLLDRKAAGDAAITRNPRFDRWRRDNLLVEHDRHAGADVRTRVLPKLVGRMRLGREVDHRLAVLVLAPPGRSQLLSGDDRRLLEQIVVDTEHLAVEPLTVSRQDLRVGRQDAADCGEQALAIRRRPRNNLLELQERGRRDQVLDPRRVVYAGQLDEDAVALQTLTLDDRFGHAELIDAVPDRLQRRPDGHVAHRTVHVRR